MNKRAKQDLLLIISLLVFLILATISHIFGFTQYLFSFALLFLFVFVWVHGSIRYGTKKVAVFFLITFFVSWSLESLSILVGFPFGNYHYTSFLGPKLGNVPVAIVPGYFSTGYLSWTLSTIFLGNFSTGITKESLFFVPVIASFIMVMWDFCFDPILSTISGAWVWRDGGHYFGVPLSNYLGWFFTVYLTFQIFALYLYKFAFNGETAENKLYWYSPALAYLGVTLEYLITPFFDDTRPDIRWSMFLATVFTMVFVVVLNLVLLSTSKYR